MLLGKVDRRGNWLARGLIKGVGGALATLAGVVGGWIAYSALLINHRLPLPPAINTDRRSLMNSRVGRLSYYVDRSGAGRPLVLLHSINAGASAYEMHPIFEHYRGQRPVYALDLPGFGFSERSDRQYSVALYTGAIVEFLESVVQEAADVIALSLTSEFAARAAQQRPDLFRSLAFISPSGFNQRDRDNRTQRTNRNGGSDLAYALFSFPLWSQAFYDLLVTPPSIRYFLKQSFVGPVDHSLLTYDYATTHQPGARFAPLYFVSGKLFSPDIRPDVYETLQLPVLVIYDTDGFVSFDALPETLRRPNWTGARIVPTRGLPQFERMSETAQALNQFWRTGEPATA